MSRTFKSFIAAVAIALTFASSALAQGAPDQSSMRVTYGDLDMASQAGGKMLLNRIESADRGACRIVASRSPLTPRDIAICSRETVTSAVRQLNTASLTQAWSGKYPAIDFAAR